MTRTQRLTAFSSLGNFLKNLTSQELDDLALHARNQNTWFTPDSVRQAISGIQEFLDQSKLAPWVKSYPDVRTPRKVGLILAGNIPLVGFHDLLCTVISGHIAMIKFSSKDHYLMKYMIDKLIGIEPEFRNQIHIVDQLKNFDAVIATGSDNSARYFDYYFGKYPHIIRKNRTSVAILDGSESHDELRDLGHDVFSYYGLGCRNVSKIFAPKDYRFDDLLGSWKEYAPILNHHKYANNYDYQKSILLINRIPFLDNGFVLLQESDRLVSPISVVFYEHYNSYEELEKKIEPHRGKIQVIVGKTAGSNIAFGGAQCPQLSDYADDVDTMKFLTALQ